MAIRWSAVKVDKAMDEVDAQINLSQSFIDEAIAKVQEARRIPNLAGYMEQRLTSLEYKLKDGITHIKEGVESVRNSIPEGAIEAEIGATKHGTKQPLI